MLCNHTITLIGDLVHLSCKHSFCKMRATCKEFENLTNYKWTRYCIQTLKDSLEELEELKNAACDISHELGCPIYPAPPPPRPPGWTRQQQYYTRQQWMDTPDSLLPEGWERYTHQGITYYVDHNKVSVFGGARSRPRCLWLHPTEVGLHNAY